MEFHWNWHRLLHFCCRCSCCPSVCVKLSISRCGRDGDREGLLVEAALASIFRPLMSFLNIRSFPPSCSVTAPPSTWSHWLSAVIVGGGEVTGLCYRPVMDALYCCLCLGVDCLALQGFSFHWEFPRWSTFRAEALWGSYGTSAAQAGVSPVDVDLAPNAVFGLEGFFLAPSESLCLF